LHLTTKSLQNSFMTLSTNAWYMKLIGWMWGKSCKDYDSLCPLLWTVVGSIIILPIYCILKNSAVRKTIITTILMVWWNIFIVWFTYHWLIEPIEMIVMLIFWVLICFAIPPFIHYCEEGTKIIPGKLLLDRIRSAINKHCPTINWK
jgi:hypothetical protein